MKVNRCRWVNKNELLMKYHDSEWGVPVFDDHKLFEILTLEIFQAGLTWDLILKRRSFFDQSFCHFDVNLIRQFDDTQVEKLMDDPKIIRNRAKIEATIHNAKQLVQLHEQGKTLSHQLWSLVSGVPINRADQRKNNFVLQVEHVLKLIGFKRVGPVTVNSFLQASGMINDHELNCFRYQELLQVADKLMKGI